MKIVIVDDAIFMRTMLKNIVVQLGHEIVAEGANGKEAIKLAEELKPDVLTLDITMPEMDGLAALPEIRKVSPNTKVVMCSAMGQQHMVVDAIKNGAVDFIVKPFNPDRVKDTLSKF
jgi:two-component system chemotaxis response regulator CheY